VRERESRGARGRGRRGEPASEGTGQRHRTQREWRERDDWTRTRESSAEARGPRGKRRRADEEAEEQRHGGTAKLEKER